MDRTYQRQAIRWVKSFLAAWALLRVCGLHTGSIMSCLFLAAAYVLFGAAQGETQWKEGRLQKRAAGGHEGEKTRPEEAVKSGGGAVRPAAAATALALDALWLAGRLPEVTQGLTNRLFCAVLLLAVGAGLFVLLDAVLCIVFPYLLKAQGGGKTSGMARPSGKKAFSVTFSACLAGWLPYLLANFPAVMTVDSFNQYAQASGIYAYSNHHPWVHTMFLKLCIAVGSLITEDPSAAIAVYTVIQMLFLALCAAYMVSTAQRCGAGKKLLAVFLLFYAVLPFQGMFSVTIWKDVPFAGCFLLFGVTVFRMLVFEGESGKKRHAAADCVLFVVSGALVCLLRSNGWYAFLLSAPFLIYFFRRKILSILSMSLLVIGITMLVKGPVMGAFGVTQPDMAESLSVPLQQVARVLAMDRKLEDGDRELIARVMDPKEAAAEYEAGCADRIKRLVRRGDQEYLEEHPEEYRSLYLRLARRFPADFCEAWIGQTSAYWCPEIQGKLVFNEGIPENEFGLEGSTAFRGPFYLKCKEIFFKLYEIIPFYGLLFSIGAYTWIMIAGAGACIAGGKYNRLAVYLPGLALIATLLLATPLNGEFRYAYGIIFSLPLYVLAMIAKGGNH